MKPKLMFVLVAALTVLLSHDAQAFYNTSTGRWLSRDPIEEQGGANVYRFASNDGINGADFMGFVVICKCPQAYFTSLGLKEGMHYQSAGPDTYTAIRGASFSFGELEKQTVWKMLESKRSFKAKNLSVEQLKRHVAARIAVTRAIWQVRWPLIADGRDSGGQGAKVNPAFWDITPSGGKWVVKQGVSPAAAVSDLFKQPQLYGSGCRAGTALTMLKGVLDVVGAGEFDRLKDAPQQLIWDKARKAKLLAVDAGVEEDDWVPGDRGWIMGSGTGINAGQWVIDSGLGMLWGFGADKPMQSLESWLQLEGGPVGQLRWYPGVGLDVRYGTEP